MTQAEHARSGDPRSHSSACGFLLRADVKEEAHRPETVCRSQGSSFTRGQEAWPSGEGAPVVAQDPRSGKGGTLPAFVLKAGYRWGGLPTGGLVSPGEQVRARVTNVLSAGAAGNQTRHGAPPEAPAPAGLSSVSGILSFLGCHVKKNHTIHSHLSLASLALHGAFTTQPFTGTLSAPCRWGGFGEVRAGQTAGSLELKRQALLISASA